MTALFLGMVASGLAAPGDKIATPGSTYKIVANTVGYTFRLDSAAFATEYVSNAGHIFASRGKKLLLVTYTIGNPGASPVFLNPGLVGLGLAEKTSEFPSIGGARSLRFASEFGDMMPGATHSDTAYLEVPNDDQAPQLMVRVGASDALRFDLAGRVKPLAGPYAQSHGLVALDDVTLRKGQTLHTGALDICLESASYQTDPVGVKFAEGYVGQHIEAADDQRILVATVRVKNKTKSDQALNGALFAEVRDSAGVKGPLASAILRGDSDSRAEGTLKPGSTTTLRAVFLLPRSFAPASLTLYDEVGGRRSITVRDFVR